MSPAATPELKLTYFDGTGRAELTRLIFAFGGISFVDKRIQHADMAALKPSLLLGQVPTLEIDGKVYAQSIAIARYAAKLSGLMPEDPIEALRADMVCETARDLITSFISAYVEQDVDKKAEITKTFLEETIPKTFGALESMVQGRFFLGDDKPSYADIHVFDLVHNALAPVFQGFTIAPFPKLHAVMEHIKTNTNIAAYLQSKQK
uniref:Glutathione S-transferase n=1 Tax=Globisporangium ultimum (strain ATCC 200006 / CBS 805.95 / DAOM BR144) TaxID=431595 RepID=K3WK05_GLOUD